MLANPELYTTRIVPPMKLLAAPLQILICCSLSFSQNSTVHPSCGAHMTPDEAYQRASAVFVGRVVEVKTRTTQRTGLPRMPGSRLLTPPFYYQEIKLIVEKSWKLIDHQEVTITTPNMIPGTCGSFIEGETYLVYADRLNDILFTSSLSRTNRLIYANEDLEVLGEPRLILKPGKFRTYKTIVYGILVCAALTAVFALLIFRWSKRPIARF